jgi:titin
VSATNSKGRSLASDNEDATTAVSTTTPSTPGKPTGLKAVVVSGSTVELYWTAPASDGGAEITTYSIEQSNDGEAPWAASTASDLTAGATPDDKAYFAIDGLTAGTAVHFRVRAVNDSGDGAPSNVVKVIPTPGTGYPAAPTEFVVEANGPAEINLTWTAPTGDDTGGAKITGYMIEYTEKESTAGDAPALPWKILRANTGNDKTEYSNTGLMPVTKRWYRVTAMNADGETGTASSTATAVSAAISATTTAKSAMAFRRHRRA